MNRRKRRRVLSYSGGESKTDQSQAADCDINVMMARFMKAGELPPRKREEIFSDIFNMGSFHESMNVVVRGREMFASLPAKVRDTYGNNPAKFLMFAEDPLNAEAVASMFGYDVGPKPVDKPEGPVKGKEAEPTPKEPNEAPKKVYKDVPLPLKEA